MRIGFEVDDLEASYRVLREAAAAGGGPGGVHAPEERDYGPKVGVQRFVSFTDPDGIGLELVEARPVEPLTTCRNPPATGLPIDF